MRQNLKKTINTENPLRFADYRRKQSLSQTSVENELPENRLIRNGNYTDRRYRDFIENGGY